VVSGFTWANLDAGELPRHADAWDCLVAGRGYPAFLRARVVAAAVAAFGCEGGRLLLARSSGKPVAATILQPLGPGRWQTFQPSQLPLGAWLMTRDCQWQKVLPSLLGTLPGLPLSVSVTQQDPALVERPPDGSCVESIDYVPTAWIDVAGTYEEFWQNRGKNLRQNLRKQRRKLEDGGARLKFDFLDQPADLVAALADFAELESRGWKAAGGTAISPDSAQGAFYRDILTALSADGSSFAMRLSLDDRPIAVDFGLRDGTTAVILKTTYDETLQGVSPGQLLHEDAFRHLFQLAGLRRIEFYGKVMDWHRRWTEQARTLFHLDHFRWPLLRRLRQLAKGRIGRG
jgi:hypothetical protein